MQQRISSFPERKGACDGIKEVREEQKCWKKCSFEVLPVPCYRKHTRRNNFLERSTHLPYKWLRIENHFFISRAHNHWKTDFPYRNSVVLGNILNWN
jgi:hypothetical protein